MDTYFASAERAGKKEIASKIKIVSKNPIMSGLLTTISGLLVILDEHRQIVAINDTFMQMLGIKDPAKLLGLRPGETLECIHAFEEPSGCGTTEFCSSCGAAIAIVSSLSQDKPVEKICALTTNRGGKLEDMALQVRSHPIIIDGNQFLLLFLNDITLQQRRAALERAFFHDVNNLLNCLVGASEMLYMENSQSNLVKIVHQSSLRLKNEVEIQKCLLQSNSYIYKPVLEKIKTGHVIEELQSLFANHLASADKEILFSNKSEGVYITTDFSLLMRVLSNMITNALEATEKKGIVKMWTEDHNKLTSFCVWSKKPIPREIGLRIFQRNFSTKNGAGRGLGTYSMKLFGERILGGRVDYTTSQKEGTIFSFTL